MLRPACLLRCLSLCRGVTNLLHRVAGVEDEGRYLWTLLQATTSISQPATGPTVSVSKGQVAAAEAQPDSPLMQAAASRPAATSDAARCNAAAATPSGGQKQRRGFVDVGLEDGVTQRKLMAWELKRPSVIPVAQQGAPDAVACWDIRSGDAPPCTSMLDRWVPLVAAGAVIKLVAWLTVSESNAGKGEGVDLGGIASGVVDNIVEVICQLWLYLARQVACMLRSVCLSCPWTLCASAAPFLPASHCSAFPRAWPGCSLQHSYAASLASGDWLCSSAGILPAMV